MRNYHEDKTVNRHFFSNPTLSLYKDYNFLSTFQYVSLAAKQLTEIGQYQYLSGICKRKNILLRRLNVICKLSEGGLNFESLEIVLFLLPVREQPRIYQPHSRTRKATSNFNRSAGLKLDSFLISALERRQCHS